MTTANAPILPCMTDAFLCAIVLCLATARGGIAQELPSRVPLAPVRIGYGEAEKSIEATFERVGQFDFSKQPLAKIVKDLSRRFGVTIVLDTPSLDEIGVTTEQPITFHAENLSLKSALDTMLAPLELRPMIRGGVIQITSTEACKQRLETWFHPVPDLVDSNAQRTRGLPPDARDLTRLIRETVAPDRWEENGGTGRIEWSRQARALVVSQPQNEQHWVAETLKAIRESRSRSLTIRRLTRRVSASVPIRRASGLTGVQSQ